MQGVAGVGRKREGGNCVPRSTSGVVGFGPVACSCSDSRPEPPAPLAGFLLDPRLALSVAAIHRAGAACHVIVALLVARVAVEHGLPD